MPAELPTKQIKEAKAAVEHAQRVRKFHRRRNKRSSQQRKADIDLALARLRDAMKPLRSAIGKFPYGPQTAAAETNRQIIREASNNIQRERRKLWKMQSKKG